MKLQADPSIIDLYYNMDFNIIDLEEEIATLDSINSIVDLPQYRATKLKSIIKADLRSLEQDELNILYLEIDNMSKESEIGDAVI